jgi:hypothetical protein
MTVRDAVSTQPSGSFAEPALRRAVLRRAVLGNLDDAIAIDREEDGEAAISGEGGTGNV